MLPSVALLIVRDRLYCACTRACLTPLQVTFKGNGVLGGMQIIADAHGNVKGKVGNPAADPPLRPDGKLDVGAAVGRGVSRLALFTQCSHACSMGFPSLDGVSTL